MGLRVLEARDELIRSVGIARFSIRFVMVVVSRRLARLLKSQDSEFLTTEHSNIRPSRT